MFSGFVCLGFFFPKKKVRKLLLQLEGWQARDFIGQIKSNTLATQTKYGSHLLYQVTHVFLPFFAAKVWLSLANATFPIMLVLFRTFVGLF